MVGLPLPSDVMTPTWTTVRPAVATSIDRVGRQLWLPLTSVVVVYLIDRAMDGARSRLAIGLLDEPGHLVTAALVLLAAVGGRRLAAAPVFTVAALAGAVLIDIDHIPLYAGVPYIADHGSRPYSHSLTTVLVLLVLWLVTGRRWSVLAGAAAGVGLHLFRDVASGPGVMLYWPVSTDEVRIPHAWYLALLLGIAVVATVRAVIAARERGPDAPADAGINVPT